MKIHFTKKEYRLLMDMLSIASWVINSHTAGENPKAAQYDEVEQKILSYAKDFGFANLIEHDRQNDKYYPTREYEEAGADRDFLGEFENEVFWDELCSRLAQRDLLREKGLEALKAMDRIERLLAGDEIAEKYDQEFVANGLRNLILLKKEASGAFADGGSVAPFTSRQVESGDSGESGEDKGGGACC